MGRYSYSATLPDGRQESGTGSAESLEAMEQTLYERDLRDIRVQGGKSFLQVELTPPRVKREELMHLSNQLAAFIRAGVPLIDATHTIGQEAKNTSVRTMMADLEAGLRGGDPLSICMERHPKIFPEYYREIIRSAELTGQLEDVLVQLAAYLERDAETRQTIRAALVYPAIICAMSLVTVVVLTSFVLPRFRNFFKSLDAKLPLPTRILLSMAGFVSDYWWAILAVLMTTAVGILLGLRTEPGRYVRDKVLLGSPVLGATVECAMVERFTRILASMVTAGVSLPESLRVSTASLQNRVYVRGLAPVSEAMLEGEGLAGPLAATALFPSTAMQMIRVGEETGSLDRQLEMTAKFYESELKYKIKKLTSLFEPAVLIVMGLVVGFVAIALVSAMYGIFNQVKV